MKLVKEALKDVLKPRAEKDIKNHFSEILGEEVGEWFFQFQRDTELEIFKASKKYTTIEFDILSDINDRIYSFLLSKNGLKVIPPDSLYYTNTLSIRNYNEFKSTIFSWLNGENADWEKELVELGETIYPNLEE